MSAAEHAQLSTANKDVVTALEASRQLCEHMTHQVSELTSSLDAEKDKSQGLVRQNEALSDDMLQARFQAGSTAMKVYELDKEVRQLRLQAMGLQETVATNEREISSLLVRLETANHSLADLQANTSDYEMKSLDLVAAQQQLAEHEEKTRVVTYKSRLLISQLQEEVHAVRSAEVDAERLPLSSPLLPSHHQKTKTKVNKHL